MTALTNPEGERFVYGYPLGDPTEREVERLLDRRKERSGPQTLRSPAIRRQ